MLEKQDVDALRKEGHSSLYAQASVLFAGPISSIELEACTVRLGTIKPPLGMVWLAIGYGSGTKSRYERLRNMPGVDVLWDAPFVPWWLYPVSFIAACRGGLLKINRPEALGECAKELSHLAMFEAFLAPEQMTDGIVAYCRRNRWKSFIGHVIGRDSRFFCLGVDGDNHESATGMHGWVTAGPDSDPQFVKSCETIIR